MSSEVIHKSTKQRWNAAHSPKEVDSQRKVKVQNELIMRSPMHIQKEYSVSQTCTAYYIYMILSIGVRHSSKNISGYDVSDED